MRWPAPLRANTRPCRCAIGKDAATILCGPNTIRSAMSGCATTAGCIGSVATTRPVGRSCGMTPSRAFGVQYGRFLQDLSTYGIGIFTPTVLATIIGVGIAHPRNTAELIQGDILATRGAAFIDLLLIV